MGMAFSKPIIETIYPKAAFAQASPMTQIDPPTLNPLGACFVGGSILPGGVDAQEPECSQSTEAKCNELGGSWFAGALCSDT